jgi:hypothetical protein
VVRAFGLPADTPELGEASDLLGVRMARRATLGDGIALGLEGDASGAGQADRAER